MTKNPTDLREQILFWLDKGAEVHAKQSDPEMHKVTNGMVADQILALISNREKLLLDRVEKTLPKKATKAYKIEDFSEVNIAANEQINFQLQGYNQAISDQHYALSTLRKELDGEEPTNE